MSITSGNTIQASDFAGIKQFKGSYADAGGSDAYAISATPTATAYTTGDVYVFKANTVNTGAATLNVDSLGAKTIKKNASVDLSTGDIKASQYVAVVYDGTNFQILSHYPKLNSGITTKDISANGAQTIAHGLGVVPQLVTVSVNAPSIRASFNGMGNSTGAYNGTSQGCIWSYFDASNSGTTNIATQQNGNDTSNIVDIYVSNAPDYSQAAITVDATNITLTWTKTNSPTGTANIVWTATA